MGVSVAQITESIIQPQQLLEILFELKAKGARLVYWAAKQECKNNIVKKFGGTLVDHKTTFVANFKTVKYDTFNFPDIVEPYTTSMPMLDIEDLAIQSGKFSRFAVDQNIPQEKFMALYKIWIQHSLRKEIAEEILIIREGDRVVGMITLGNKNGRGDIGLVAVDENSRRKRYGEILVRAAQQWFLKNGYEFGQVVTQGMNIPACNLYKKCGYSVESVDFFYHFWL